MVCRMKRVPPLLLALASPAWAQGVTSNTSSSPGFVSTPSRPPPAMSVPAEAAPPTVLDAVTGQAEPMPVITVPAMPPAPVVAYPAVPFPKPEVASASELARGPMARAPAQNLVSAGDYPASALAVRAEGRVAVLLTVGVSGRALDCAITRSSGSAALDAATCRILRSRGRFTPAMDRHGNAAVATIAQEMVWKLP